MAALSNFIFSSHSRIACVKSGIFDVADWSDFITVGDFMPAGGGQGRAPSDDEDDAGERDEDGTGGRAPEPASTDGEEWGKVERP